MSESPNNPPPASEPPEHHSARKRWIWFLSLFFITVAIIFTLYWVIIGQFYETTNDAYVSGNSIRIMPEISGRIVDIMADETDRVTKGQIVIKLDPADAVVALQKAESQFALTVRQVSQLYQNVSQLQSNLALQQDNLQRTQEDYKRRQGLVVEQSISQEALEHAKLDVDSASAAVQDAKYQLDSALGLISQTDLYHHPQVLQAAANLRAAYLAWQRTTLYAPDSGYIAKRVAEVGQEVTPNTTLMVLVPLSQVWVDANFKESQLKNIRIGQPVTLTADAYGKGLKYHGVVIGFNPGTGSAFDLLPPQNATGNWIKIVQRLPVRILINSQQLQKYPLQIGLSMTTKVDTHQRNGQVLSQVPQETILYQTPGDSDALRQVNQIIQKIMLSNAPNVSLPNAHKDTHAGH
jgi:membrane fusion protein (multidrug efflux system)